MNIIIASDTLRNDICWALNLSITLTKENVLKILKGTKYKNIIISFKIFIYSKLYNLNKKKNIEIIGKNINASNNALKNTKLVGSINKVLNATLFVISSKEYKIYCKAMTKIYNKL